MNKKLNIAFISDTFCPDVNGIATYLKIISKALSDNGHTVTIYTHKKAVNPLGRDENVKVVRLPAVGLPTYKGIYACVPNPLKLRRSLILLNPDIIHIHSPPGPLSITALAIAKSRKIPVVATVHGFWDRYENYLSFFMVLGKIKIPFGRNFLRALKAKVLVQLGSIGAGKLRSLEIRKRLVWGVVKMMYNRCDAVIVPSLISARKVKSYRIPCLCISHGVDINTFRRKKDYRRKNAVLSVCRLGYEKKVDIVLRAFCLVAKLNRKVKLTIVGDGPARKSLIELAKTLGLEGKVFFPGTVQRNELQKYFDGNDFFVNASDSETFGYVVAEAMAAGLPVVAVKAQGTKDIVKHGVSGYLSEVDDIRGLAESMEKMLSEPNLKKMGTAAYLRMLDFSVKKFVEKHERLYCGLLR